jgi:hypothetical protein
MKTANNKIVAGIMNWRSQLFCSNNNPKAISIPMSVLEKWGAKASENPKVYNCFTSKVEIAK